MKLEEKAARDEIKKKSLRSIYYLYGDDAFKIQDFIAGLSEGQTTEAYFGDELDPGEFLDSVRTRSLWSQEQKMMIVRNADAVSAKKWELLADLWSDLPLESVIVFVAARADARTKHIQALGKHQNAALVKFESPSEAELFHWANGFAKRHGKRLSEEARRMLVAGSSLFELMHDLEKAALFSGTAEEITVRHVEQTGVRAKEESVFSVMDAVLASNEKEALAGVAALLAQREEPLGLIAILAKQYDSILKILSLRSEGMSESDTQRELGLHPFVAKKLISIGRRIGPYAALHALKALAEADITLKSSREPADLVLSRTLIKIIGQSK